MRDKVRTAWHVSPSLPTHTVCIITCTFLWKRKQLNPLAELLWHTVPPGSVISDLKQMEDGFFPLYFFNWPGTTLSLLYDNYLPHPPCCTWIELGHPSIGAKEKIVWESDGLCIILSPVCQMWLLLYEWEQHPMLQACLGWSAHQLPSTVICPPSASASQAPPPARQRQKMSVCTNQVPQMR